MRKLLRLSPLLPLLTFVGCTVGPNFKRPVTAPPDTYYTDTNPHQSNSIADLAWWELFKDPVLQDLIKEALKNNYDVKLAAARIEEARAQYGIAESFYYPQIGYGALKIAGHPTQVVIELRIVQHQGQRAVAMSHPLDQILGLQNRPIQIHIDRIVVEYLADCALALVDIVHYVANLLGQTVEFHKQVVGALEDLIQAPLVRALNLTTLMKLLAVHGSGRYIY